MPKPATPDVAHYGEVRAVFAGNWQTNAELADLLHAPDVYALGALSELRGEFVTARGATWLAYPTEAALPRVVQTSEPDETATLLVMAKVPRWRELTLPEDVAAEEVTGTLRELAIKHGVDASKPFPFLVRGQLRSLAWHVVDGTRVTPGTPPDKNAQHGNSADAQGVVVGFYSEHHQGVFTMMGSNVHMHVMLDDGSVAGHVQTLAIARGAVVSLPH